MLKSERTSGLELPINLFPVLVLAATFGAGVLGLRYYAVVSGHKERMAAIERGEAAGFRPLLLNATPAFGHRIYLLRGLVWIFGGAALVVALTVMLNGMRGVSGPPGLIGIVPMSVGLAYLAFYWIEERREHLREQHLRQQQVQISGTFSSRPPSSSDA